jgi:hypothetical protein
MKDVKENLTKIKQDNRKKPQDLKEDERRSKSEKGWSMIKIIRERLLLFACIDFTI